MELTHDFRQRTALLLGDERMARLQNARVAVFGLGGVGGACAEALCRAGVGRLTLVDNDTVSLSNINRQIVALHSTVGQLKTAALRARLLDINPACDIEEKNLFFDQSTADSIDFSAFDYVIDAIDTVSAKLLLVERARAAGTPILCCMGTGNKLEPTRLRWSDESPCVPIQQLSENGRHPPGSVSFVPPVAGMILAGQVVRELAGLAG